MTNNLSCQEAESQLERAYDGELSSLEASAIAEHLASCPRCTARDRELHEIGDALRGAFPSQKAPPALVERIMEDLTEPEAERNVTRQLSEMSPDNSRLARPATRATWRASLPRAASLIAVASLGWIASSELHRRGSGDPNVDRTPAASSNIGAVTITDELVASHVRSLLANHITDVRSTDQHTVKPWFTGKLDYAPAVLDLRSQGFPLLGGRLDYIDGRPVAALVYGRRKHVLNLFVWPASSPDADRAVSRDGFVLRHWVAGSMSYWAVSDATGSDLETLERLYRSAVPDSTDLKR